MIATTLFLVLSAAPAVAECSGPSIAPRSLEPRWEPADSQAGQEPSEDQTEGAAADEVTWPAAPAVVLTWNPRGPRAESRFAFEPEAASWVSHGADRYARLTRRFDDVAFIVWLEQFAGLDATRVTVGAINGFASVGPRYFERYAIEVDGKLREDIEGQHVVLPRGALLRRFHSGPRRAVLSEWNYVHENLPVPDWAPAAARKDTAKRKAFPFRNMGGRAIDLGPYNFFWGNKGLSDSHGGWGVGPFHGGPDDWLACAAGRQNREAEMLLGFQRPIWMLADDFSPLELQAAYWMGRTEAHEPVEYQYEVDGWCPYAAALATYDFADHTHLSRGTAGAATIASWDVVARECLGAVLNDFKVANSLRRVVGHDAEGRELLHPGALQDNPLLFPLWKKIEVANGPASNFGDRGLAHQLRLLRWCRPFFPAEELEPYEAGLRQLTRKLADSYGVTTSGFNPSWVSHGDSLSKPLRAPFVKTFHQQLVAYECLRFGGLEDLGRACARFLTARPPAYFELRPGAPADSVHQRHHSADQDQEQKRWSYEAYGNLTHGVLHRFEGPSQFLATMKGRGVNGSSQDLDCTPREVWASALD